MKTFLTSSFRKKYLGLAIVLFMLALFAVLYYTGAMRRSDADLVTQISYSITLAVSLNLVVGFLGELSLGHAGFMCVGAYVGCLCEKLIAAKIGQGFLPLVAAVVIGGAAAALAGFLIGVPTLRLKGDYLAIVTLAFGEIVRTVVQNQPVFGGALGLKMTTYSSDLFVPGLILAALCVIVIANLMDSKHGRAIKAIRDSEIAAGTTGVDVTKYKMLAFVIAAAMAGMAGVIYGNSVTPIQSRYFDFNNSINILVMVVLGGMGNITGSILSAAALTFFDVKLTTSLPGNLAAIKNLIYALILVVVVIYNNAPKLKAVRSKYNLTSLLLALERKVHKNVAEGEGVDDPTVVDWSTIPTKIDMDAILSTDLTPDTSFTPDKEQKGDRK